MEHIMSGVGVVITHIVAGVIGALLFGRLIEPLIESWKHRKELRRISWLFPITTEHPQIYYKCSLKPPLDFSFEQSQTELFNEFFGRNPPTYRRYTHSSEVLALQRMTEWLTKRGVQLLPDAFYGEPGRSTNLLLLGSGANVDLSTYILEKTISKHIGYPTNATGHRQFTYGSQTFECRHSQEGSSGGMQRVVEDSGLIIRVTQSDGSVVLLLAGIHMHGTLAAAEVALNPEFQKRVLERKYRNFAQFVRVKVLANGVSLDQGSLDEWRDLPFVNLD